MLIMCLGSHYFNDSFVKMGHRIITAPHQEGFSLYDYFNTIADRPDLLVYTDNLGQHFWPQDLSKINIPKVYYAVDTPLNYWWQKHFASLFDLNFADQKNFADKLSLEGHKAHWLPVAIDVDAYQYQPGNNTALYDFGFVGVVDEKIRPKRSRLVKQLSSRFSVKNMGEHGSGWVGPAESAALYRQSRLVLNECLFPGVTTRMLEAMASGTVLFTEKSDGTLGELFKAGEDFAWFEPGDLIKSADYWLNDEALRQRTAARAYEKVKAGHDIFHRAETILEKARNLNPDVALKGPAAWDKEAKVLFWTALRWPNEEGKVRIMRAEHLLVKTVEEGAASPEGMFMLGHIARLRGEGEKAAMWLIRAWENGYRRAALALGVFSLGRNNVVDAQMWLGRFTGLESDFPSLQAGVLQFEAVIPIAEALMGMGEVIWPGFSLMPHDPSLWTAFEFYQSAASGRPQDLQATQALASILIDCGAVAEAAEVAGSALEHHPQDEQLSLIYGQAAQASYLSLN